MAELNPLIVWSDTDPTTPIGAAVPGGATSDIFMMPDPVGKNIEARGTSRGLEFTG